MAARIPGHGHLVKVGRRWHGQVRHNVREAFWPPLTPTSGWKDEYLALHSQIQGRVTQRVLTHTSIFYLSGKNSNVIRVHYESGSHRDLEK